MFWKLKKFTWACKHQLNGKGENIDQLLKRLVWEFGAPDIIINIQGARDIIHRVQPPHLSYNNIIDNAS